MCNLWQRIRGGFAVRAKSGDQIEHVSAIRRRQLLLAVVVSVFAKVLALAVQLLAFPIALHSLGTDRYASYLALQSFLSWTGLCGLGISFSLPKYIAAANITKNEGKERSLIVTALVFFAGVSLLLVVLLGVLGLNVSPAKLVAVNKMVSPDELRVAYFASVILSAAQLFTSITPSLRSGYQELYRPSICAALASGLFVLPGLFYVGHHPVTMAAFIVIVYFPLVFLLLGDLVILFFQRPYLRHGPVDFRLAAGEIVTPSGNALALQAEYALIVYLPTWIVAHMTTAAQTAAFGSVLQVMGLGASSLNLIFQPLMAALANAHGHSDRPWIERNYRRSIILILGVGLFVLLALATIGTFVVHHWLGRSIQVSRIMLIIFGVYFLVLSFSLLQFYVLSALGALRGTGPIYLLQGVISLGLGTVLCHFYGNTGMVAGLAIGMAATVWMLPLRVRREIRSL